MNVYLDLTDRFNDGGLRAVLSSGQAVVLHRLAVMSKDGDWILRETPAALDHVLTVLEGRSARYRFGAPLDARWMRGGWSSHLEFREGPLRVRTDFVTRPPRIPAEDLEALWTEQEGRDLPYVDARRLVELKKTNREKDYAVIGELARLLESPRDRILCSRSARDLVRLGTEHPDLLRDLETLRPVLGSVSASREELEAALDAERRHLMRQNEQRLRRYQDSTGAWAKLWPDIGREIDGLTLREAHRIIVDRAGGVLPFRPGEES